MKFDDHLAAYIYQNKSLTLEGIGTFILDDKVRSSGPQEKEGYFPSESLAFTYNPKSRTDESIISFLVKRLGKIEPLIRSDVESYLLNMKQFLNIGEAYIIEGIGTLSKNNEGMLEFTPGNSSPLKEEPRAKRENQNNQLPERSKSSAGRTIIISLIAISALGAIGWGVVNFIKNHPTSEDEVIQKQEKSTVISQSVDTVAANTDTAELHKNSQTLTAAANTNPIPEAADSVSYKMIFEITKSKERAYTRTAQLNDLHSNTQYDSIPINDSVAYYRLFLPMKVSPADIPHIKDSLKIFFGKKIFAEKAIK